MEILSIWVGYGKNERYVCADKVAEDALDLYKKMIVNAYRAKGWTKEFHFIENGKRMTASKKQNGYSGFAVFTKSGHTEIINAK